MMQSLEPQDLVKLPLFKDLTAPQLAELQTALRHKRLATGKSVLTKQRAGETVYILLQGTVKIVVEQANGTEAILAICGAGEVLGEINAVDGLGHSANVVTLEESSFLCLERATFCHYLRTIPGLAFNVVLLQARRLRRISSQAQMLATLDIHGRLAYQLLTFATDYGQTLDNGDIAIPIRLTQSELAALIGATRVSVNRILASYRQNQYISISPAYHITLHNRAALLKQLQ